MLISSDYIYHIKYVTRKLRGGGGYCIFLKGLSLALLVA